MTHRAATDHPVQDLFAERWSPYAFADRPVSKEDLLSLFEAARWAPSSYNEQPEAGQGGDVLAAAVAAGLDGAVVPHERRAGTRAALGVDVVDGAAGPVQQSVAEAHADGGVVGEVDPQ